MAEPITVTITNLNSPIRTAKVSNKVAESAVTSVAGRVGDVLLTQSDVAGLENVNNTSDLNKPISTATQAALDANGNGDMLASNNLSDVTNAATSRTNLGLAIGTDVQAHSAVLDNTTASFTTADETRLNDQVITDVIDKLSWNATDLTFDIETGIGVVIQIGEELLVKVRNKTGVTIFNGSVVKINGASGSRPTVELAQSDSLANIDGVIGIVTADILNNQVGFATVHGLVRDLNTSAFNEGDEIFLSDSVAGGITNVEPPLSVPVGTVTYSNPTNGTVFANVDNQKHLLEFANDPTLVGSFSPSGWKTGLGLENVDNTSDLNKPVSTATQDALDNISLTPGPSGLQGDIGPSGLQGLQGDIGLSGLQGLQGDIGPSGLQGLQGDIGPSGADAVVDNTAYGISWSGDITQAATRDALYNEIEILPRFGDNVSDFNNDAGYITSAGTPSFSYRFETGDYTVVGADYTIDCISGNQTITMLDATSASGQIFVVKNSSPGVITITGTSSQTFDGNASVETDFPQSLTLQSTNINWIII